MTRTEIRRALEAARRTGTMPFVAAEDLPMLRREARRMGLRMELEPVEPPRIEAARTDNDCLRVAVSQAYAIAYADTPSFVPDPRDDPGKQRAVWEAWAAERGLRWWGGDRFAPFTASRWIACVPSRVHPDCTHALAMTFDRLLFPTSEWPEVRQADIRQAFMLLPVDLPETPIECWAIGKAT